jgi:hypothetical protein
MTGMFSTLKAVFPETECPRNGCLSAKTLFNSQRETYFLLKPDAPKTNAFHVKDVVNIEPFLFDTMPPKTQNGCLYERCSQCEASSFKAKCPRNGCLSAKTF